MRNIVEDCKKYLGLAPYDTDSNIVRGDGFYYNSLCSMYGESQVQNTIKALRKERK